MLAAILFADRFTQALTGVMYVAEGLAAGSALYLVVRGVTGQWTDNVRNRTRALLLVTGLGSLAATVMAWLACKGPFLLPGRAGVLQAAEYVIATAAAGSAAAAVGWLAQERRPRTRPGALLLFGLTGWALLPMVMMLAMGHSPLALAATLLPVAAVVLGLRRMAVPEQAEPDGVGGPLPTLYGLPLGRWAWRSAAVAALCVAVATALAAVEQTVAACGVLMLGVAIVLWRWSAALRRRRPASTRRLGARAAVAASLSVAVMVLMQQMAPRLGMAAGVPAVPQIKPVEKRSYFSVVLLQPPEKKHAVTMPRAQSPGRGGKGEPVVIPFDGPYWYFQPPLREPDAAAHIAHGHAGEVNVSSVDDDALLMEAHQPLLKPVALSCCSAIDVSVSNADARPGRILLAVLLRDSGSRDAVVMLDPQVLRSSENGAVELRHGPVEEVLHFPFAARSGGRLRQFDEIDVLFLPTPERLRMGTKVDIRSFTLQP